MSSTASSSDNASDHLPSLASRPPQRGQERRKDVVTLTKFSIHYGWWSESPSLESRSLCFHHYASWSFLAVTANLSLSPRLWHAISNEYAWKGQLTHAFEPPSLHQVKECFPSRFRHPNGPQYPGYIHGCAAAQLERNSKTTTRSGAWMQRALIDIEEGP